MFNNTQLLDYKAEDRNALSIFVNGGKVSTSADYRGIKLDAHDEIAIVYGLQPLTESHQNMSLNKDSDFYKIVV
jgi:hypothetical protein